MDVNDSGEAVIVNSFGAVNARGIRGDLSVRNDNGSIDVSNVNGSATLNGSFGSIDFANVQRNVSCSATNSRVKGGVVSGSVNVTTYIRRSVARTESMVRLM